MQMRTILKMILTFIFVLSCVTLNAVASYRVVCVYTNWSQYRPEGGTFLPEDIDPSLCTHVIYVYAKIQGNKLMATEWNDEGSSWSDGMYDRVNNLKQINPEMKTLLGVGGWTMGSKDFSRISARRGSRRTFAISTIKFLRDRNFDGLTIDWQNPTERGGRRSDKNNFSKLLRDIRSAFTQESKKTGKPSLMLTIGVSANKKTIDNAYEIDKITKYIDFMNVLAYDLHGSWDNRTGHPSQLYPRKEEVGPSREINVHTAMKYWISKVPDRSKLILGISTYGRTFTLKNPKYHVLMVPTKGPGIETEYTKQAGMISYYERCSQYFDATRVWDKQGRVAYWYQGNQWIGLEDEESVREKVNWIRYENIGGVMINALDMDDFQGVYCSGVEYPLLNAIVDQFTAPLPPRPKIVEPSITILEPKPLVEPPTVQPRIDTSTTKYITNIPTTIAARAAATTTTTTRTTKLLTASSTIKQSTLNTSPTMLTTTPFSTSTTDQTTATLPTTIEQITTTIPSTTRQLIHKTSVASTPTTTSSAKFVMALPRKVNIATKNNKLIPQLVNKKETLSSPKAASAVPLDTNSSKQQKHNLGQNIKTLTTTVRFEPPAFTNKLLNKIHNHKPSFGQSKKKAHLFSSISPNREDKTSENIRQHRNNKHSYNNKAQLRTHTRKSSRENTKDLNGLLDNKRNTVNDDTSFRSRNSRFRTKINDIKQINPTANAVKKTIDHMPIFEWEKNIAERIEGKQPQFYIEETLNANTFDKPKSISKHSLMNDILTLLTRDQLVENGITMSNLHGTVGTRSSKNNIRQTIVPAFVMETTDKNNNQGPRIIIPVITQHQSTRPSYSKHTWNNFEDQKYSRTRNFPFIIGQSNGAVQRKKENKPKPLRPVPFKLPSTKNTKSMVKFIDLKDLGFFLS